MTLLSVKLHFKKVWEDFDSNEIAAKFLQNKRILPLEKCKNTLEHLTLTDLMLKNRKKRKKYVS